LRLDIRRIENIKQGDVVVGMKTRVKVVKNKMAPPYRAAEFEVIHGFGVSREGCLLDMGVEAGIVEKTGSWLLYKNERLGQGRENAKDFLKNAPNVAEEIEKALKAKYLIPPGVAEAPAKTEIKAEAHLKTTATKEKASAR
jgi:recombination protein RecA